MKKGHLHQPKAIRNGLSEDERGPILDSVRTGPSYSDGQAREVVVLKPPVYPKMAKEMKLEMEQGFLPIYRRNFLVILDLKFKRSLHSTPNIFMFIPK